MKSFLQNMCFESLSSSSPSSSPSYLLQWLTRKENAEELTWNINKNKHFYSMFEFNSY